MGKLKNLANDKRAMAVGEQLFQKCHRKFESSLVLLFGFSSSCPKFLLLDCLHLSHLLFLYGEQSRDGSNLGSGAMPNTHKIQAPSWAGVQRVWVGAWLGFENIGSGPPIGSGSESLIRWMGLKNL